MVDKGRDLEKKQRSIIFFDLANYFKSEGLPAYFKKGNLQLLGIIVAIGFFFAGYNLSIFFDTVLLKEFLCSPGVFNCIVFDTNRSVVSSNFNLIRTFNLILFMLALIIGGAISDDIRTRYGNRLPMIITGSFIAGLGYILAPLFIINADIALISGLAIYGIIGIGFGLALAPEYSLLSELFKKQERGWAGLGLAAFGTIGTIIGLMMNAFFVTPFIQDPGEINWTLVLVILGFCIILLGLFTFLFTPRLNPPFPGDNTLKDIRNTPKYFLSLGQGNKANRDFFLMFFVSMLWGGGAYILSTNLPGFIGELRTENFTSFDPGSFLMIMGIAGALFAAPVGFIISKFGKVKGGMIASVFFAIFALLITQPLFWDNLKIIILALLAGLASIFITTVSVSLPADLVPRGKEGQFMGLFIVAGNLLAPILGFFTFALLAGNTDVLTGYIFVFILTGSLYIIAFVLLAFMNYEKLLETEYQQFYRRYLIIIKKLKIKMNS